MSEDKPDCSHYYEFTWGEPPLEPDENGRLVTEYRCKKKTGNLEVMCGGYKCMCDLKGFKP